VPTAENYIPAVRLRLTGWIIPAHIKPLGNNVWTNCHMKDYQIFRIVRKKIVLDPSYTSL
jgi:hypothetical protein